jgi:hypothetical protein
MVAECAGYIVWVDSKLVIFYSNILQSTPLKPILDGHDEEVIACVRGLGKLHRWVGNEIMHCTCFKVPSIIVAYNAFMSGADCLDQKRATNATKRREKKVYMSIFTYVLDLACTQAHSLFVSTQNKTKVHEKLFEFVEFKRQIAQDLVTPWQCVNNKATPKKWTGL